MLCTPRSKMLIEARVELKMIEKRSNESRTPLELYAKKISAPKLLNPRFGERFPADPNSDAIYKDKVRLVEAQPIKSSLCFISI